MSMTFPDYWFSPRAAGGFEIDNSLRFRNAPYLLKSNAPAGNGTTYTTSCWVKLSSLTPSVIYSFGFILNGQPSKVDHFRYNSNGTFLHTFNYTGTASTDTVTTGVYLDYSGWYHLVVVVDTGNAVGDDRIRIYINGVRAAATNTPPTQNASGGWGTSNQYLTVGKLAPDNFNNQVFHYFDGYIAEFHAVDNQALDPTTFGEFNADGVWVPKEVTGVTYGTKGFYLDFSNPANIGADSSGNGNDFTPTGFQLTDTTSSDYDWTVDTPTNNYQTINELTRDYQQIYNARRTLGQSAPTTEKLSYSSTFKLPSEGKWYTEWSYDDRPAETSAGLWFGVCSDDFDPGSTNSAKWERAYRVDNGNKLTRTNGTATESAFGASCTTGDQISVAVDMDQGHIWFAKNGVWQGSGDPATGANPAFTDLLTDPYDQQRFHVSIRNRVASLWDGGVLPFVYTPPTGFSGLSTATLPNVDIKNPGTQFTTILDTGANILTNAQSTFANGLWWIKDRDNSNQHQLVDSINGTSTVRQSPADINATYAAPTGNSVAWCWATPASGINTTAGFSITSGTHGLGVTPAMVIDRSLNVWHQSLTAGQGLELNTNGASAAQTWTVNATTVTGPGGGTYFTWAEVPAYSAFGSYVGNSDAEGPFVYTNGFRPAFVMIKSAALGDWHFYDSQRDTYNPVATVLRSNNTTAESAIGSLDFLSNGFKLRTTTAINTSATYIYAAFAEHCFGGGNVAPSPAR